MLLNGITIARILVNTPEDFEILFKKYYNSAISVTLIKNEKTEPSDVPGILIDKNLSSVVDHDFLNIQYVVKSYNTNEELLNKIAFYIDKIVYAYQPYEEKTYDAILDGEFNKFLKSEIDLTQMIFLYFEKKCLYLYCYGKLIIINLESLLFVGHDFKKIIFDLVTSNNCVLFSFNNYFKYTSNFEIEKVYSFENIIWSREQYEITERNVYDYFGGVTIPKNIPYIMDVYLRQNHIDDLELASIKRFFEKDIITHWLSEREIYFKNSVSELNLIEKQGLLFCKVKYSNKRAITNRIYSHDDYFNIQNLPKQSEIRNEIISRYKNNGNIVVFDFISFEARIAIYSTSNKDFIHKFKLQDIHEYIAKIIFNKSKISREERNIGKKFNHALLYGGGEEKLRSILKEFVPEEKFIQTYDNIILELKPIIELSESINEQNKELGYIINPYGTIIRPRKNYAAFNNFIQSTASEIVIDKLFKIKNYIKDTKINFMYQVFDSFVFDISNSEMNRIDDILKILVHNLKMDFPVEYKIGKTLMDCTDKSIISEN